jgi:hypothetical protein
MNRTAPLGQRYCTTCGKLVRMIDLYYRQYCELCYKERCELEGKRFKSHNGIRQERKYKRLKGVK